jgi:hypothetical protein
LRKLKDHYTRLIAHRRGFCEEPQVSQKFFDNNGENATVRSQYQGDSRNINLMRNPAQGMHLPSNFCEMFVMLEAGAASQ